MTNESVTVELLEQSPSLWVTVWIPVHVGIPKQLKVMRSKLPSGSSMEIAPLTRTSPEGSAHAANEMAAMATAKMLVRKRQPVMDSPVPT
jgi:hypothetical protein